MKNNVLGFMLCLFTITCLGSEKRSRSETDSSLPVSTEKKKTKLRSNKKKLRSNKKKKASNKKKKARKRKIKALENVNRELSTDLKKLKGHYEALRERNTFLEEDLSDKSNKVATFGMMIVGLRSRLDQVACDNNRMRTALGEEPLAVSFCCNIKQED